jgi:hypothetical protein
MKKKNLFTLSILMLGFFIANAQDVEHEDMILNFGLGFGNNYTAGGDQFSITIPPISASFEYVLKDNLFNDGKGAVGVGIFAQYMNYNYSVSNIPPTTDGGVINTLALKSAQVSTSSTDWKYNTFVFGPRGYLHYSFLDELDTYTGLMLGLTHISWGTNSSSYKATDFEWAWFVGGRYYFTDNFAGMLELGYGATYVNIGVALKLGN